MANADTLDGAGVNSGNALDAAKIQLNSETMKFYTDKYPIPGGLHQVTVHAPWPPSPHANYFSNKKIEKQRDYNAPQALSGDTELTARAANVLNSAAKVQQNSEITKLSSKKELPPVTPLGTNRRGISKAAQTILAPRPFLSQRKINQLSCQAREPHRSTKRKAHQPTFPICASSSSCSTSSRCCRKSASCSLSQMFMLSFFIIQSDKPYIMLITSL